MGQIVYSLETAAHMLIETQKEAAKAERERITFLIQNRIAAYDKYKPHDGWDYVAAELQWVIDELINKGGE